MKKLALLVLLFTGMGAHTQSVLDGVYVKEHIPTKDMVQYHTVYPLPLYYTYADTFLLKNLMDSMPVYVKALDKYPKLEGQSLIGYHINDLGAVMPELEAPSCRLLFYRLARHSENTSVESFTPPFVKFGLQDVQLVDTGSFPYFRLKAKPFMHELAKPFYMKNTEVTNAEYREFVNHVKDSIAREILYHAGIDGYAEEIEMPDGGMGKLLNYKTPLRWDDEKLRPYLQEFFRSEEQRYYRRREIDTEKLIYRWRDANGAKNRVNVYPDTLCWVNHFPEMFNDPTAIMYFWHPAFNQRPVVGLTIWQIEAYLDWKTKKDNKALAKAGKSYRVRYVLPNEMQWELASAYQLHGKKANLGQYLYGEADHSYLTNLMLAYTKDTFETGKSRTGKWIYKGISGPAVAGNFSQKSNGSFNLVERLHYQHGENKSYSNIKTLAGLNNGVSEYLSEEMNANYKQLLELRWILLESWNNPWFSFMAQQESTLFTLMNSGTHLVRGGNWLDARTSEIEGMNAKCFVDGQTTYPTLGFRYVTTLTWIKK